MKRIFLMNFSTPILIDVAKNLKDKGIDIVYWQGYRDDFDELAKTKQGFEKTIFRHSFNTIKNIMPPEIDKSEFPPLDKEIIEKMYPYAWHALAMIARADYGNPVFVKRRRVYYEYLKNWRGMIENLKPNAIVFVSVPHSAQSFVLYGLAKILGIKTIMLGRSMIDSRALVFSDYKIVSEELKEEYNRINEQKSEVNELSDDIKEYYIKQNTIKTPSESEDEKYSHLVIRNNQIPFKFPSLRTIVNNIFNFTLLKTTKSYLVMLFSTRIAAYYNKDITGFKMMLLNRKWSRMNKQFRKEYHELHVKPDYKKKYVYVPLSFQPEQTTCPRGDVFDDQFLMVDIISSSIPDGWVVYVI